MATAIGGALAYLLSRGARTIQLALLLLATEQQLEVTGNDELGETAAAFAEMVGYLSPPRVRSPG